MKDIGRNLLWGALFASALFLLLILAVAAAGRLNTTWYYVGAIVYGAILLVLLVALLIGRVVAGTAGGAGRRPHYPFELYKMSVIEEISPADLDALRGQGVNATDTLLYADLDALAKASGITKQNLARWHAIAQLLQVNGIGPKWATRLVDAGVRDLEHLAEMSAKDLEVSLLAAYRDTGADESKVEFQSRTLPGTTPKLIDAARKAAAVL